MSVPVNALRYLRGHCDRDDDCEAVLDAVAALISAAQRAYPPGDYSQDMHGHAIRSALELCGVSS